MGSIACRGTTNKEKASSRVNKIKQTILHFLVI